MFLIDFLFSQVIAQKAEPKVWKVCGEVTLSPPSQVSSPRSVGCRVVAVGSVSHDTTMLALEPRSGPVVVPLGHHVRVHRRVNGKRLTTRFH